MTSTDTREFDYPVDTDDESGDDAETVWEGTTGVGIGNLLTRALFALRFGDLNLLISDQLTDESQVLFDRAITERVPKIAPFLAYDHDPYLVSADGRLLWVWDAYTQTDRYPNSQPQPSGGAFPGANYIRNSVKVVVDAYDGTVRFFLADPDDPIIAAYARIFPDLFEPLDAMPARAARAPALSRGPVPGAEPGLPALPPARAPRPAPRPSTARTTGGRSRPTPPRAPRRRWSRTT